MPHYHRSKFPQPDNLINQSQFIFGLRVPTLGKFLHFSHRVEQRVGRVVVIFKLGIPLAVHDVWQNVPIGIEEKYSKHIIISIHFITIGLLKSEYLGT